MPFCLLFVLGILLQNLLSLPGMVLLAATTILLTLAWRAGSSQYLAVMVCALTVICGMFRLANVRLHYAQIEGTIRPLAGSFVEMEGEVRSARRTEKGPRYVVQNVSIQSGELACSKEIGVRVIPYGDPRLSLGDRVKVRGIFRSTKGPRNPGEFDFKSFYRRRNIWASIYEDKKYPIVVIKKDDAFTLAGLVEGIRGSVRTLFQKNIGGDAGKLVSALTVGLREEIPAEIKEDFADTGVIHVLAVSGLHVGFVLVIFLSLTKLLRLPYRWDKLAIILALIAFAGLSGGRPSVWRATIMASFYVIAPLFQREVNFWNIIAASSLVLLISDPENIFDAGFLLSFSAVISIVFFYKQIDRILPSGLRVSRMKNPVSKGVMALFIVSLCAQIGTLPFTWAFFNRIPIVSLAANVMIVPIIGILVSTGFCILILGSWIPYVGEIVGNTSWLLSEAVFRLTSSLARLPFAYLELGRPSLLNVAQYVAILGAVFLLFRRDLRKKGVLVAVLGLNLFVWPWALQRDFLDVIFLDVGQGDAAIIRVPTKSGPRTILVDVGMKNPFTDKGESVVVPVLKHLGTKRVDLLIMTHPHQDHIGGVQAVMANFPVHKVWDTYTQYSSQLYGDLLDLISEQSVTYERMASGDWIKDFRPAHVFVLHPDSLSAVAESNVNNVSIVTKVLYGQVSFLLMGDVERDEDRNMMEFGELNRSAVLKVAHHGSAISTSSSLLDLVRPQYAIISVGERNQFHHPSEEVILRLEKSGAAVLRTDRDAACWFKSDGRRVWLHHWR